MAAKDGAERARAVVLPFPRTLGNLPSARALVPSIRSILIVFALVLAGAGAYAAARATPVFAVRTIEVRGVAPADARRVRAALAPLVGTTLLSVTQDRVDGRIAVVPAVASARFDRAFPHTLRLVVTPEQPVAVVRQGKDAWVVSARGRVIRAVPAHAARRLPRIWAPAGVDIGVGERLPAAAAARAAAALAVARSTGFPYRLRSVRADGELTFVLARGLELRLGDTAAEPLKLEIARRIVPQLGPDTRYLDVSVPARPVGGGTLKSKVEVEGCCPSSALSSR